MTFPVDLSLLQDVSHMPALPVLERSMNRSDLQLHDYCIPVNSYFPTQAMMDGLRARIDKVLRYYPGDNQSISERLGDFLNLDPSRVVVANGSTELITWINHGWVSKNLVTDVPTFGRWTDTAREIGRIVYPFYRRRADDFQLDVREFIRFTDDLGAKAVAICNPNNPTGAFLGRTEMMQLLDAARHLELVVIDESFIDFASADAIPTIVQDALQYDNVIVIKSLGKNLGLHGLRCGYAVASEDWACRLRRMLPPWNVNAIAEDLIRCMPAARSAYEESRRKVVRDSRDLQHRLARLNGITAFPTHANFVFCELDGRFAGRQFRDELLQQSGCLIRECGSKLGGSAQFLRIATRPAGQQRLLVRAMQRALTRPHRPTPRRFPPVASPGSLARQRHVVP